jgi:hypothetical protein
VATELEYIRHAVSVDFTHDPVDVRYGFWSVELPRDWVSSTDGLERFLKGDAPLSAVELREPEAANLVGLLRVAGCLTSPRKESYALREVRSLFEPLCISWHAHYYDHPLWSRIREGRISRNALVAWVVHNYHLSQSAGVTAARCATRAQRPDVKRLFLESAIEEYSHCREYYRIDDSRIGITAAEALEYVHLPASLAFDQQMFRLAEDDWLAHILVGYFQESTSSYFTQCAEFYDGVEKRFDLAGFFDGWKGHIRLDLDFGHASAFADALESDESVSLQQVEASFKNAAVTVQFLIAALDEILAEDREDDRIVLRRPVSLKGATGLEERRPLDFGSVSVKGFVESELADACCRALSYAQTEAQLLSLGRLVEIAAPLLARRYDVATWCVPDMQTTAIVNFVREAATNPAEFVSCLAHLLTQIEEGSADSLWIQRGDCRAEIARLAESCRTSSLQSERLATRLVQFDELFDEPDRRTISSIEVDILR